MFKLIFMVGILNIVISIYYFNNPKIFYHENLSLFKLKPFIFEFMSPQEEEMLPYDENLSDTWNLVHHGEMGGSTDYNVGDII